MSTQNGYSDIELLAIIQEHADGHVAPSVTTIHNDPSCPSKQTYARHFGSWRNAVEEAGLVLKSEAAPYDRSELLDALRTYHNETGDIPSAKLVQENDDLPSYRAYRQAFGGIKNALTIAGITQGSLEWTADGIIEHMQRLGEPGNPPHGEDLLADSDAPAPNTVRKVFGGLRSAAEAAGYDVERGYYGWTCERPSKEAIIKRIDQYVAAHGETPALDDVHEWDGIVTNDIDAHFGDWRSALHAAGYPARSHIPASPGGHPCSPNGGREVEL